MVPAWKQYVDDHLSELELNINSYGDLYSTTWRMGGIERDYYGYGSPLEPMIQPEFSELDLILQKVFPDLSYAKYKAIWLDCVTVSCKESDNWFNGIEYTGQFRLNFVKLYNSFITK